MYDVIAFLCVYNNYDINGDQIWQPCLPEEVPFGAEHYDSLHSFKF